MWQFIIKMLVGRLFKLEVLEGDRGYVDLNLVAPEIEQPVWPKVWEYVSLGGDKYLFWMTDGVFYRFFTWSATGPQGGYSMGKITTKDGREFNIRGGWSSREGAVNLITGLSLVEIKRNGTVTHINLHHALVLAQMAGLVIEDHSYYRFDLEGDEYIHPNHAGAKTEICYGFKRGIAHE